MIRLHIQITLKDLKLYCKERRLTQHFSRFFFWIYALATVLIGLLFIVVVVFLGSSPLPEDRELITVVGNVFLILAALTALLRFGAPTSDYLVMKHTYTRSPLQRQPAQFCFSEIGLEIRSASSDLLVAWEDIRLLREYRSSFAITLIRGLTYVVPCRCFPDESQLVAFRNLLTTQMSPKQLRLKNFPLGSGSSAAPVILSDDAIPLDETTNDSPAEALPLLDFETGITRQEITRLALQKYVRSVAGRIMIAVGCLLFLCSITLSRSLESAVIYGLAGAFMILAYPCIAGFQIGRMKLDTLEKIKYRYRIFPDHYTAEGPFGSSRILWTDLHSIQETASFIALHLSPNTLHPIPKRVFSEKPEDYQRLRTLLESLPNSRIGTG